MVGGFEVAAFRVWRFHSFGVRERQTLLVGLGLNRLGLFGLVGIESHLCPDTLISP